MSLKKVSPYGSWISPITSDLIASSGIGMGQVVIADDDIYWNEVRPMENGRNVIVQYSKDKSLTDLTPPGFNARTRVHEYGGLCYAVHNGVLYFSNFADQRLYRISPGELPEAITPAQDYRYADGVVDADRMVMYCVREDHTGEGEAVNTLVMLDLTAGGEKPFDAGKVLISGNNFYSNPRLSPKIQGNSRKIAWLTWNHPNLPWDGTELWVGEVLPDGSIGRSEKIAGGVSESIFQPEWSPDGTLYFVSDRTNWWNLYRWVNNEIEAVYPLEAEFGSPQWVFGMSTYAFESPGRMICSYTRGGESKLAVLNTSSKKMELLTLPFTEYYRITASPGPQAAR